MSTRAIVIWVIVIIIVAVGGYFIYQSIGSGTSAPATASGTTATTSADKVQAQDVSVGTGAAATPGSEVSVLYVGKLPDGTVFDSSAAHGNQPLTFTLGSQGIIPGFQIGVNGMKVGGERILVIPPSLGYGSKDVKDASGTVIIPGNSTLTFDVKLVKVAPPASTSTQAAPTTTPTPAK